MGRVEREIGLVGLERFRDETFPFMYWVDERRVAREIVGQATRGKLGRFGLETGFGIQPTRVFLLNLGLRCWLLTESNDAYYAMARATLRHYWPEVGDREMPVVLALSARSTRSLVVAADHLVYRNLDYRNMEIPHKSQLSFGQTVDFIVNGVHARGEMELYRGFIARLGYNADRLVNKPDRLPQLFLPGPHSEPTYVLHVVGE